MDKQRLEWNVNSGRGGASSVLTKLLTFAVGAVLLVVTLMFSALLFAVALTAGLLIWARLWWKTRDLRKRMREQSAAGNVPFSGKRYSADGRVIEGEVIREDTP